MSTSYKTPAKMDKELALVEAPRAPAAISKPAFKATTPEQALEILRSEPDYDALISTLQYLGNSDSSFNIAVPNPLVAQLVHVLVSEIIPNYWSTFKGPQVGKKAGKRQQGRFRSIPDLELLLSCLRSVTGLNAVLLSIKQHIQRSKDTKASVGAPNIQDILTVLLQALTALLDGDEILELISSSIWNSSDTLSKQTALWNEFLGLVGSGKILGITAEAEDIVNALSKKVGEKYWVADGLQYSCWLARNISLWTIKLAEGAENEWKSCGGLLSKSLRLGYAGTALS